MDEVDLVEPDGSKLVEVYTLPFALQSVGVHTVFAVNSPSEDVFSPVRCVCVHGPHTAQHTPHNTQHTHTAQHTPHNTPHIRAQTNHTHIHAHTSAGIYTTWIPHHTHTQPHTLTHNSTTHTHTHSKARVLGVGLWGATPVVFDPLDATEFRESLSVSCVFWCVCVCMWVCVCVW